MEELFGFGAGELTARSTRVLYRSDQLWNDTLRHIDANLQSTGQHDEELEFYRRDGRAILCRYAGRLLDLADPTRGSVWIFADVTKRREAEQSLERANVILIDAIESIPDAFAIFDREDKLVVCNRKYLEGAGEKLSMEQAKGLSFEQLVRNALVRGEPIPEEHKGDAEAWVAERLRRHHEPDADFIQQFVGGRWIQARDRRTSEGGIVTVRTDITDLRRNQERAEFLANHDPLTELPNRRLLEDRLVQALSQAKRNQNMVALMVLDLDRFKDINDRHGHRVGDEVLRESAQRLRGCVRAVDTVSRMGGDEFVIVLSELRQAPDAALVAQKILDALAQPMLVGAHKLRVACSIGIAEHISAGDDPEALLKAADLAMYRAKEAGSNAYRFAAAADAAAAAASAPPDAA
jgi:two-component system CheB/CheR fusion protein